MSGRIRSIKPEVLEDELAASLSDSAWRMWVSMWVLADDHGDLRAGNRYLAANVWQDTARDVSATLQELIDAGFVRPYAVQGQRYVRVSGWAKHQRVDNAGKPRVPTPEEDDGSWDQQLSPEFAAKRANRGESPRPAEDSANRETIGGSPLARASRAQSGGETTTPISTSEHDPDRDRAPARGEIPPGVGPEPERPSGPVVIAEVQARAPGGSLPDGVVRFERNAWVAAYQDAVNAVTERPPADRWTLPEKKFSALRKVVEAHCQGDARKNIAEWIRADVTDFVRAVHELNQDPKLWSDYDPDGLQRWHNKQRPGLVRDSGVRKASAPPPLEKPTMSAADTAAAAARVLDMLKTSGGGTG